MNFICTPCKKAADSPVSSISPLILDTRKSGHSACLGGTYCDCQHRVTRKV